jgi:hypothetical protein
MAITPPNTPPLPDAPVNTPLLVEGAPGKITVRNNQSWQKWMFSTVQAIAYLLSQPVSLSGPAADLPEAALYPQNSRYFATDTNKEYIVLASNWVPM